MAKINWFPGHMNKAFRQIQETLREADFVVELRDARAPLASANPLLQEYLQDKPRLIILNKADLADPQANEQWQRHFAKSGVHVLPLSSVANKTKQQLSGALHQSFGGRQKKGPKGSQWVRASRGLVVGIPNVGKSTLINTLSGRHKAKVEDRAGVTRQVHFIPLNQDFSLFDSPGVLWPNLEDQSAAARLAMMGSIKEQILEEEQQLCFVMQELERFYPGLLQRHYEKGQKIPDVDILDSLARRLQCLEKGGKLSYRRLLSRILRDYQQGRLGRLSLEFPNCEGEIV